MKRGPFHPYILMAAAALLLAALPAVSSCGSLDSESGDYNQLTDLRTCAGTVDERCEEDEDGFSAGAGKIFVTATVMNPVDGTEVRATLTRVDGGSREKVLSYSVGIESDPGSGSAGLLFFFTSEGRLSPGTYEVELLAHGAGNEPLAKTIEIR